nr:hypothetical protein L203_05331 [Cryptococcus depauperatus CBS 7841]
MATEKQPQDLLLLVWVHGFKGNNVTFESFPDRIVHLLQSTHPSLRVASKVFPMYQTRGELHAATLAFVDWLTELVVKLENDHGQGGGAGKAKVVLLGHSMGGLLCVDTARDIAYNTRPGDPMWPRIISVLAFDTPYLGLHPHTFKHHLTQVASYFDQAKSIANAATMVSPFAIGLGLGKFGKKNAGQSKDGKQSPSGHPDSLMRGKDKAAAVNNPATVTNERDEQTKSFWSALSNVQASPKTLYGLGAAALGAAAVGAAYYRREDFVTGWKWGYDHMTFVKNLWDEDGLKQRLGAINELSRDQDVLFTKQVIHATITIIAQKLMMSSYYTHLPPSPPKHLITRTFSILPPIAHPLFSRFKPATNTIASDEVSAHMGMFNATTNDGFYDLGLCVARELGERLEKEGVKRAHGVGEGEVLANDDGESIWRIEKRDDGTEVWIES